MNFLEHTVKGLARCLVDEDVAPERLHIHVSEIEPGARAHPPHRHDGLEALYVLAGEGTFEIDEERRVLKADEAVVFDPRKLHGLVNTGTSPMRYVVILTRDA